MRRFLRSAMLGLLLVLVGLSSALMAMRFAIHGREVKVPKLTALTLPQADAALSAAGMTLDVEERFFSATIPEGSVVSQIPLAGTNVRRGWHVRVAVSLGQQREPVPNVLGESGRVGEINVQRRGLEVTTAVVHLPGLPPDQVVAQSPPPDSRVMLSPKVNLLTTAPEPAQSLVMQDFTGRRITDAAKAIADAGLKLGGNLNPSGELNPGEAAQKAIPGATVLRQSPTAGQKVSPGDVVVLEISQ